MSTLSLEKQLVLFSCYAYAGYHFIGNAVDILLPKRKPVKKVVTKQELEDDITECKNKINTAEIFIKHNEESIKTIRRELEEALKVLREENTGEETVKNKRKQLDKMEEFMGSKMNWLEFLKGDLKKLENQLKKFEIDETE